MSRFTLRVAALSTIAVLFVAGLLLFNPLGNTVDAKQDSIVRQNTNSLPSSLLPVAAESLGKTDESYHIMSNSDIHTASTPAHGLETEFANSGVTFTAGESSVSLKLDSLGRGDQISAVSEVSDINSSDNKIEYTRADLTEWYVNSPFGMEQGFTLSKKPQGETPEVAINLSLDTQGGLSAHDSQNGKSIFFKDKDGNSVMSYGKLYVYDAAGKELKSSMKLSDYTIVIAFNDQDAIYPVVVDPFMEVQMLFASDGNEFDFFGFSSAINRDYAILGAPFKGNGYAYIFEKNDLDVWVQTCRIRGEDHGAGCFLCATALFGQSVDIIQLDEVDDVFDIIANGENGISGQAVIGGPNNDTGSGFGTKLRAGSVWVFERDGETNTDSCVNWTFKKRMEADDDQKEAHLGESVSITYDKIIAGAPDEDWGGSCSIFGSSGCDRGAAYIFERNGSWPSTETQRITASDGGKDDEFGSGVAIWTHTALVGAPFWDAPGRSNTGAAYFFEKNGSWSEDQRVDPAESSDEFGQAVDLAGGGMLMDLDNEAEGVLSSAGLAIVGAPDADIGCVGCDEGEAYVFEKELSWVLAQKVAALIPQPGARLGTCVGITPEYAVAGAPLESFDPDPPMMLTSDELEIHLNRGAVYVYDGDDGWSFADRLTASDTGPLDFFGASCGVSYGYIIVGAPGKDVFDDIIIKTNEISSGPKEDEEKPEEVAGEREDPKDDPEGELEEEAGLIQPGTEGSDENSADLIPIQFDQGEGYIFRKEQTGRIKIIKETIPDGFVGSFDFEGSGFPDGNPCDSFSLSDGQMQDCGEIPAGGYEIVETEMHDATLQVMCDSGTWFPIIPKAMEDNEINIPNGNVIGVAIDLQPGDDITCTFTNTLPLVLSPIFPAVESNPNFMTAAPVTTNGPVGFIWGFQLGAFPISLPCGNIELGINPFIFLGVFNAGANQIVNMSFYIALGGYANPAFAQAVDLTTCVVSDVVPNIILNTNLQ